jgi:ankyrin repeat protein
VVILLLKVGADIYSKDKIGITPLFIASKNGREAVIRRLLDSGADNAPLMANVRSIFMIPFDRHELFTGRGEELNRLYIILWCYGGGSTALITPTNWP